MKIFKTNSYFAIFLCIIIFGYFILKIHNSKDKNMWDFKVYYYAAKVFEKGQNPYILENLKKESNGIVELKFVYPYFTLFFFKIFTKYPMEFSFDVYLILKYILFITIFILWSFYFLGKKNILLFVLFSVLAFKNTILADFATGNVSIFEQFFSWIGFYFFVEKRYKLFLLSIFIASVFKITPLFFLILLIFTDEKNKYIYILAGILAMFLLHLSSYLINPLLFKSYLNNSFSIDERGDINPSLLPLLKDLFEMAARKLKIDLISKFSYVFYIVISASVLFLSIRILNIFFKTNLTLQKEKNKVILFFLICIYTLILPRFKEYSYIILLLPAFFIILNTKINLTLFLLFFIYFLIKEAFIPDINKIYDKYLWAYYLYLLSCLTFILYLFYLKDKIKNYAGEKT